MEESGFITTAKFWNTHYDSVIVAGSTKSHDVKLFSHLAGKKQNYEEVCHVRGLGSGILSVDSNKTGDMLAFGT